MKGRHRFTATGQENPSFPFPSPVLLGEQEFEPRQLSPLLKAHISFHAMSEILNPDESHTQSQGVAPSDANTLVSDTDPRHWTYIAEGGSTIVFSYDGPRNHHVDGTVIRLRKSLLPRSDSAPSTPGVESQDVDDPTVDFQEHVVSRLVPPEFLPHLEHVQVERGWLERMVSLHDEQRPAKRRAKDGIDVDRTRAVLATDLIGSKGWAVEIKVHPSFRLHPYILYDLTTTIHAAYSQSGDLNLTPLSLSLPHAPSSRVCAGSV